MTIPDSNKLYPRTGDPQTIYLKNAITRGSISVGDYTCTTILFMIRAISRKTMCSITIPSIATG